MGIESTMGSYQGHSTTNTGAANRKKMKNAGYGGVRFKDTKGGEVNWSGAGIIDTKTDTQQYGPQTAAEVAKSRSGIAPTAKNMGSLAVQYRADEATAIKSGELTDRNKRDQKIIDARGMSAPRGNTEMAGFKKRYWKAREEWAEDKGKYSGIVPSGSEADHGNRGQRSNRKGPSLGDTNRGSKGYSGPNSKYGLF